MRRICCFGFLVSTILLAGCGGGADRPRVKLPDDEGDKKVVKVDPVGDDKGKGKGGTKTDTGDPIKVKFADYPEDQVVAELPKATKDDTYEDALLRAVDALADKKYDDALKALKDAQAVNDTGAVQREIYKVETLIAQGAAAEKAVTDVKTVLEDGKPDEAAKLATEALSQFGGGDFGDDLSRLKQQADAVVSASTDDTAARKAALAADAAAALKEGNLRAAAVAYEQVLAFGPDALAQQSLDDVREKIRQYDDARARADAIRREPGRLDEALVELREARKAWDTPQVRQDIDRVSLVIERRRDRLSVADFEVRGDVGVPAAGRAVAEEIIGHFKPRFDLIERAQLNRVIAELKLDQDDLTDGNTGREVARLARVKYLVVGSITPLAGLTAQARLVEVSTGVIVQTARVSAPDMEALLPKLKQLAVMLQMSDAEKLDYEARLVEKVVAVKPIDPPANIDTFDIPALPAAPAPAAPPPPPLVTYTPRPPAPVVVVEVIRPVFLAPVVMVPPPPPPPLAVVIQRETPLARRMFSLSLSLGDDCYRRGNYREANRHFGLALSIGGPRRELALRVDACRPFLAPPPPPPVFIPQPVVVVPNPVVVVPRPVFVPQPVVVMRPPVVRPRVAVFGFSLFCRPGLVPPASSEVIAEQFAAYCRGSYDIIDRGEVSWYMGRLGITMADVLAPDGTARRALAQSLNARYLVFGRIEETASFNVETSLIDAETGARTGAGKIHVQTQAEIKSRLGELAAQMGAKPEEQKKMQEQSAAAEKSLTEARSLMAKDPGGAVAAANAGLKANPNSAALKSLLAQAEAKQRQAKFEADRREQAAAQRQALEDARKRQQALLEAGATARIRAEAAAKSRTPEAAKAQETQRDQAAARLRVQAKAAAAKGDHAQAARLFSSSLTLKADPAVSRELAESKVALQKAAQDKAAAEVKAREEKLREQAKASQDRVEKERAERAKAEAARKADYEAQDKTRHDAFMKEANFALTKNDYPRALAAAEAARKALASPESLAVVNRARNAVALAEASKKGAAEKERVEKEQKAREEAERTLTKNREAYSAAMKKAQDALVARKYDEAATEYQGAIKLFRTEAALTGLKSAQELSAREKAAADADRKAKEAVAMKATRVKEAIGNGDKLFAAKQWSKSAEAYRLATTIDPTNLDAQAGLSRANREASEEVRRARVAEEMKTRAARVAAALKAANTALAKKDMPAAKKAAEEALGLDPANAEARAIVTRASAGTMSPAEKQREENYQLAIGAAKKAMDAKNYDGAAKAFAAALVEKPGDRAATDGRNAAVKMVTEAAFTAQMTKARAAMAAKQYKEAFALFDAALKMKPGEAEAVKGKAEADAIIKKMTPPPVDAKKAAFDKEMAEARANTKAGKYADAVRDYDAALKLIPSDPTATRERAAVVKMQVDAAYKARIAAGKAALAAKKGKDALDAFDAALKLVPADAEATKGRNEALALIKSMTPPPVDPKKAEIAKYLASARAEAKAGRYTQAQAAFDAALKLDPTDKDVAEERAAVVKMRVNAAYKAQIAAGKTALAAKKGKEALDAFDAALKMVPGDAEAVRGKREAEALIKSMTPAPVDPKKAAFDKEMAEARANVKAGKYVDAVRDYDAALKLIPSDATATKERAEAVRLANEAVYKARIERAKAAFAAKKFADAVTEADFALKIKPADPEASRIRREAVEAQKKPPTTPMPNPMPPVESEFDKQMRIGLAAEKEKKYANATTAFTAAMRAVTGDLTKDATARTNRGRAVVGLARVEHAQGRFAEAVKLYEAALKLIPDNAAVKDALARAKANKP